MNQLKSSNKKFQLKIKMLELFWVYFHFAEVIKAGDGKIFPSPALTFEL